MQRKDSRESQKKRILEKKERSAKEYKINIEGNTKEYKGRI